MTIDKELKETYFDMKQAADICKVKINGKQVGRNELFKQLRKKRILQEGNNLPFRKFIDEGYFFVKKIEVQKVSQYNRETFKTMISSSGVAFIKELFKENT